MVLPMEIRNQHAYLPEMLMVRRDSWSEVEIHHA